MNRGIGTIIVIGLVVWFISVNPHAAASFVHGLVTFINDLFTGHLAPSGG